jgi:putative FmdB family regulatory protein
LALGAHECQFLRRPDVPTYQYACTTCDERFERVQAFTDASLTSHEPGCGGPLRKLFGSVGVVFKGSGFYRNDSRSGVTGDAGPATSESSGSKTEGSSESTTGSDTGKTSTADTSASKSTTESKPDSGGAGKPATSKPAPAAASKSSTSSAA